MMYRLSGHEFGRLIDSACFSTTYFHECVSLHREGSIWVRFVPMLFLIMQLQVLSPLSPLNSLSCTVEPLLTDTPCKRTPLVSGHHFEVPAVSLRKPYICNLP